MIDRECSFYICPTCFETDEYGRVCHEKPMIFCGDLKPGDERLKPLLDAEGNLKTRAPRWFLESLGYEFPS